MVIDSYRAYPRTCTAKLEERSQTAANIWPARAHWKSIMSYKVSIRPVDLIHRRVSGMRRLLPIAVVGTVIVGIGFSQKPDPSG